MEAFIGTALQQPRLGVVSALVEVVTEFVMNGEAWKERNAVQTAAMLDTARKARDRDWKPAASVAEGDVQYRMLEYVQESRFTVRTRGMAPPSK